MTGGRRFGIAIAALVVLYAAVVVAGVSAQPSDSVAAPSRSRLRAVEDIFTPRHLRRSDISRGGPTCLRGNSLTVPPGGGCTFIVPDGAHVMVFRRVPGSAAMTVTVSQTVDLTQTIDTGRPGPDPADPLRLRLAAIHDGTTVTLSGCRGPGPCRLDLSS